MLWRPGASVGRTQAERRLYCTTPCVGDDFHQTPVSIVFRGKCPKFFFWFCGRCNTGERVCGVHEHPLNEVGDWARRALEGGTALFCRAWFRLGRAEGTMCVLLFRAKAFGCREGGSLAFFCFHPRSCLRRGGRQLVLSFCGCVFSPFCLHPCGIQV